MTLQRAFIFLLPMLVVGSPAFAQAVDAPQIPSPTFFEEHTAPPESSFFISNAPKNERGDRMVIRGVVTDGENPIPGASVYIYHTDAEGRYHPQEPRPGMGADSPRLYGYMRTDAVGRYVYGSMRPAPYPGSSSPARVRFVVTAEGFEDRAFEIWFEGDPMISPEHMAAQAAHPDYFYIRPAMKDTNKVWQITHNIVLERM